VPVLTDQRFGDIISQKTMSGPIRLCNSALRHQRSAPNAQTDFRRTEFDDQPLQSLWSIFELAALRGSCRWHFEGTFHFIVKSFDKTAPSSSHPVAGLNLTRDIGNWGSNDVPVKTCASSYGLSTYMKNRRAPNTLRTRPATSLANSLTFYTDSKHTLTPILGPAGWKCSTFEGADGTSEISIYPPRVRNPVGVANGTEETMGIEETMIPACRLARVPPRNDPTCRWRFWAIT
jgi:hypothetical protein